MIEAAPDTLNFSLEADQKADIKSLKHRPELTIEIAETEGENSSEALSNWYLVYLIQINSNHLACCNHYKAVEMQKQYQMPNDDSSNGEEVNEYSYNEEPVED